MSKFKKGDRVRYIGNGGFEEFLFSCDKGDEFVVYDADEDSVTIDIAYAQTFDDNEFELVSESDPTTAFLTELQALMRKYDARIDICLLDYDTLGFPDVDVEITFEKGDVQMNICYSCMTGKTLTPDNIFDYEK